MVSNLGCRYHWQNTKLATTTHEFATVFRFNAIFGSDVKKKSPIPAKIFTQPYVSHLMPVKQSFFKTQQTLVNLSGELRSINKASYKEGCIVNLLGVEISWDV